MRPGVAREASHKIDFKEKSFLETKMIIKSTQQFQTRSYLSTEPWYT